MPFREKMAWIALAALLLVFGGYFYALAQTWDDRYGLGLSIALMVGATVMLTMIMTVLALAAALLSPKEAVSPADERERLIDLKAERIASYALSAGVFLLIVALLAGWNRYLVANLLLGALVISEVTKALVQIVYHRAGAA